MTGRGSEAEHGPRLLEAMLPDNVLVSKQIASRDPARLPEFDVALTWKHYPADAADDRRT